MSLLPWRRAMTALLPTLLIGCQSVDAPEEGVSDDEAAIIGGNASGPEDDATVLLLEGGHAFCTATLIAPNVLLTALHCVAESIGDKVGAPRQAESIVVHVGSKRSTQSPTIAAVGVKVILPAEATPGSPIESRDIALLVVQSTDSAFDRLKPRKPRSAPVATGAKLTAVGWGHADQAAKAAGAELPLQRMRRSGVEVLSGSGTTTFVSSEVAGVEFGRANKRSELTMSSATCNGDSGGPAFDDEGAVAGVTALGVSVRGHDCSEGSLSVYTDVSAFAPFIASGLVEANRFECLNDSACLNGGAGKICDTKTHACVEGCRIAGAACAGSIKCTAPSDVRGVVGACGAATPPVEPITPVDPLDPYAPPPPVVPTPQCLKDSDCGGSALSPSVCAARVCAPGCRVNAPGHPCGSGRVCAASPADPGVGSCRTAPADAVGPLQPPTVLATPPQTSVTPSAPGTLTPTPGAAADTPSTATSGGASTTKGKAAPREKLDQSGCSIGFSRAAEAPAFLAMMALLAIARVRRSRCSTAKPALDGR